MYLNTEKNRIQLYGSFITFCLNLFLHAVVFDPKEKLPRICFTSQQLGAGETGIYNNLEAGSIRVVVTLQQGCGSGSIRSVFVTFESGQECFGPRLRMCMDHIGLIRIR